MSNYAKLNLREVEDQAPKHGFGETQEARFAGAALDCETIGLALESVKPHARQAFGHRHEADEEVYVVIRGRGRMRLDDEVIDVGPMDAIRVAPGVTRAFEADADGIELVAFGTHTEGDGEIDPGFWTD
jgi:mannose-6-phosphate isomerase-like protein (cupin superfamily)